MIENRVQILLHAELFLRCQFEVGQLSHPPYVLCGNSLFFSHKNEFVSHYALQYRLPLYVRCKTEPERYLPVDSSAMHPPSASRRRASQIELNRISMNEEQPSLTKY